MKLPNFCDHEGLKSLKQAMGIPDDVYGGFLVEVQSSTLTYEEAAQLSSSGGLEVSGDAIDFLPDGTIAYKGNRVLLYIRDIGAEHELPRFHVSNCSTLRAMQNAGRRNRYVIATDTSGVFKLNIIRNNTSRPIREKLAVCRNCLTHLNYQKYHIQPRRRENIVREFSIAAFFEQYSYSPILELPDYDADTAPDNIYNNGWTERSKDIKERAGWRCQGRDCGVLLSHPTRRKYLHTHHQDGNKSNDRLSNLIALCIQCHADQPFHDRLRRTPEYQEFMRVKWKDV